MEKTIYMKTKSLVLGMMGVLTLALIPTVRAEDAPVTLARTYKKGDVTRHKNEAKVQVMGIEITLTQTEKTEVKEVKEDGQVIFIRTGEGGKVNFGGNEMDIPATPAITETRDKWGKLVEYKRPDGEGSPFSPEIEKLLQTITEPLLSDKAVKAGDKWETSLDNPAASGKKVKVMTTFIGTEKVDDVTLWKLEQTAEPDVNADGGTMTAKIVTWLDPASGKLIKQEADMKDLPGMQMGMSFTMTLNQKTTLVKDEKK